MKKFLFLVFGFVCVSLSLSATIKVPKIFSDNMVIQRDRPVKIWGWTERNASITIVFNGQSAKAKANKNGAWVITFNPMPYGGPYEMKISTRNEMVTLTNILIGDVWLGSGQSNMEWVVKNSNNASDEIAAANYDKLRLFTVNKAMSYSAAEDIVGGPWQVCSSQTVGDFSAVAYFFGRKLLQELDVPIGLINSSWGGTLIETWISWDIMSMQEEYKQVNLKDYEQTAAENKTRTAQYEAALKQDKGITEKWFDPAFHAEGWKAMDLPREWHGTELGSGDGIVWFRKEIELTGNVEIEKALLALGPVDDRDDTYVNGVFIGSSHDYSKSRQYQLEAGTLKKGKNIIVVKVTDTGGGGGLYGKNDQLFLDVGPAHIPLEGPWQYKSSAFTTDFGIKQNGPNSLPSQLYNAMIAPMTQFGIKGVIWYQGEANASKAKQYQMLFPTLIKNWRSKWGYEFPFFWVQLANFLEPSAEPVESDWAELREAQTMTLHLPHTGQALAIDIGEAKDIHPRNKQDVGLRLALNALKITYGKDIVYSGPVYQSMTKQGNSIRVRFNQTGSGLHTKGDKYGYVRGFSIAGADKKYVWAKARIEGDEVVVYHDDVKDPVSVRYAWSNNPDDANLYNKEGLPATPFRTE
jgi:sialate O-acetylesterase